MQGTLVTWKPDKGFGFIRPAGGGKDVFVHLRDFGGIARTPRVGDVIRFQRVNDGQGRYRAADVEVAGLPRKAAGTQRPRRNTRESGELRAEPWRWLVAAGFAAILAILATRTALPVMVLPVYVAASLIALLLYAFDKSAAMNRRWRTTEATLLLAGLLGGWPGAVIAQGLFRHKSSKLAFLVPFWLSVVLNCAFLAWACSTAGAAAIHSLID
jgi:uncharacterized membrane protein YsdA (DUF1294 family)/cold shock CspA family protein